jgi:hypothetical protein
VRGSRKSRPHWLLFRAIAQACNGGELPPTEITFTLKPLARGCSNSRRLRMRFPKIISHAFRTQVDTRPRSMPRRVAYFDSQASAAATLSLDIYELRDAKAAGCPAFRSGRVYRDELVRWLKRHRSSRNKPDVFDANGPEYLGVELNWENRRPLLFLLLEFLDCLFADGVISAAEYLRLGDKTIPLITKIGRVWKAGIDEAGYRDRWRECRGEASLTRTARVVR